MPLALVIALKGAQTCAPLSSCDGAPLSSCDGAPHFGLRQTVSSAHYKEPKIALKFGVMT